MPPSAPQSAGTGWASCPTGSAGRHRRCVVRNTVRAVPPPFLKMPASWAVSLVVYALRENGGGICFWSPTTPSLWLATRRGGPAVIAVGPAPVGASTHSRGVEWLQCRAYGSAALPPPPPRLLAPPAVGGAVRGGHGAGHTGRYWNEKEECFFLLAIVVQPFFFWKRRRCGRFVAVPQ